MSNDEQRPRHPMYDQDEKPLSFAGVPPARAQNEAQQEKNQRENRRAVQPNTAHGAQKPGVAAQPADERQRKKEQTHMAKPAPQKAATHTPPAKGKAAVRRPKKGGKRKLAVALTAVLLVFAVLGIVVFAKWTEIQSRIEGEVTDAGVLPPEIQTLPEYKGSHVNFVVCGIDYNNEDADGFVDGGNKTSNTDMILYVNYNIADNKANILQLPRDTYVGEEVATGGHYKINAVYPNSPDSNNRMASLARVLYNQFALPVDFYVTLDMDALKEIVGIKGWIDVFVPQTVSDPQYGIEIAEGWQRLDGNNVEFLLRNRHSPNYNDQGDIARLRTQQSFYSAIFREFKSLAPVDLVKWMNVVTYRVKTDMDLWDLGGIAQKALSLEADDITFVRPACAPTMYNGEFIVSLIPEDMAELLNEYFRPEGQTIAAAELGIHTRPVDPVYGVAEREIVSMETVRQGEAPMPANFQ